ncbi:MAG TPA: hypothetical protein VM324_07900 [Egibacteraceae bacterium]|nr:hypothetical protein [Egibacteraceae bacterium]
MDVESLLSKMEHLLAEARPVPLSASVMVNRHDFDELIGELRAGLPEELRQSRWIIKERDEVLAQAARESEQLIADARAERDRLVGQEEVVRAARREADRILEEARDAARTLRLEAEDYADGKLATFEITLHKTLKAVEKGRDRLRGRLATDELADVGEASNGLSQAVDEYGGPLRGGGQFYDHEA